VVGVQLIGHRGAAALAPENTPAAIDAGLLAGADGVEVDVRLTSDGALVLLHDADLASTTDGVGRVADVSLEALRTLDAGYRFSPDGATYPARGQGLRVPTIAEALDRVPPERSLIVEIKGTPWEAGHDPTEPVAHAVALALREHTGRALTVSSFNPRALEVVRARCPGVRTAVLTPAGFDAGSNLDAAVSGGHEECHVPGVVIDEAFVSRAHAAGRRVVAWTIDEPDLLRALASYGVDAVICDDPGAARRALGQASSESALGTDSNSKRVDSPT
jgi:glycerophosphoryl diester phosphodiesterase